MGANNISAWERMKAKTVEQHNDRVVKINLQNAARSLEKEKETPKTYLPTIGERDTSVIGQLVTDSRMALRQESKSDNSLWKQTEKDRAAYSQYTEKLMKDLQDRLTKYRADNDTAKIVEAQNQLTKLQKETETHWTDRVTNTLSGAAKQSVGNYGSAFAVTTEGMLSGNRKTARGESMEQLETMFDKDKAIQTTQDFREKTSAYAQSGATDLEQAKKGLSGLGRLGIDVASGLTQLGMDVGIGAVTGLGAMPSLAVRAFGGAADQARADGASVDQQIMYGLASATVEVLTEKLASANIINTKAFGKGALDDLFDGIVAGLEDAASTANGKMIMNRVGSILVGGMGEGMEEGIAGVVEPFLAKLTYGKDIEMNWKDIGYQVLVGALTGAITGVSGQNTNDYRAKVAENQNSASPTVDSPAPVNYDKSTQQAVEKAQTADLGKPVVAKTATVLDTGTTAYLELGMKPKRAEAKAKVVQKLINGEQVSLDGMKSLNLTDAKYRAVFTQLTGVQFPEGMTNHDQLMNVAKTASEVRNNVAAAEAPIVPQTAQEAAIVPQAIAQDIPQTEAQMSGEILAPPAATEFDPDDVMNIGVAGKDDFAQIYRQTRNAQADDVEIDAEYGKYLAQADQAKDSVAIVHKGKPVTRKQYREMFRAQNPDSKVTDTELNKAFSKELSRQIAEQHNDAGVGTTKAGGHGLFRDSEGGFRKTDIKTQKLLDKIGKRLGISIRVNPNLKVASGKKQGKAARGYYNHETRTLEINPEQGVSAVRTLRHELTHYIQDSKPEVYKQLVDVVKKHESYGSVREDILSRYKGIETSEDRILDEIMAEYAEQMCTDEQFIEMLAKTDRNLFEILMDAINEFFEKLKGIDPEIDKELADVRKLWAKALSEAEKNNAAVIHGKESFTVDGGRYSYKSMSHDIREGTMYADLTKPETLDLLGMKKADIDKLFRQMNSLLKYMEPNLKILDYNEEYTRDDRPYHPYKQNSDPLYKISLDYSTMCTKRLLTQHIVERLQVMEKKPMSAARQMAVREKIKQYAEIEKGLQVACAMCYVESARLHSPEQVQHYLDNPGRIVAKHFSFKNKEFNAAVKEMQTEIKRKHGFNPNASKGQLSKAAKDEFRSKTDEMRENYKPSAEEQAIVDTANSLPVETYLTAENLAILSRQHPEIYDAFTTYIRNATRSKSTQTPVPYYYGDSKRGDVKVSDSFIAGVNAENGMRFSSWSDYMFKHVLDMMTAVIELSVRGSSMHGYTKFPQQVRVFGKTGMMFNLSGVAEGMGLDENGRLVFSDTESVNVLEARKVRNQYPETAGMQCIGVSDEHIRKLMATDWIDYIIPYHVSGMSAALRRLAGISGWKDYSDVQHAKENPKAEKTGDPKWHKEPVFSEFFVSDNPGDGLDCMRRSAEKYKQLCAERGLAPKFNDFKDDPNYWKLLIDRKMINQRTGALIFQKPVKPIFNFREIRKQIREEVANYDPQREQRVFDYIVEHMDEVDTIAENVQAEMNAGSKGKAKELGNEMTATAVNGNGRYAADGSDEVYLDGVKRKIVDYNDFELTEQLIAEKVDELEKRGNTVTIPKKIIDQYAKQVDWSNKSAVRALLRDLLKPKQGESVQFKVGETGITAYLTSKGLDHSVGGNASPKKAAAFSLYDELTRNAEYVMSSYNDKHNSGNTEVLCWDTFVAVATVDGESYPVSLKVRTVADDTRSQIYEMATKKETGLSREAAPQNNQGLGHSSYGASPISGDTVTQDRGDVKGRYAIDETDEKPFSLDDYTIDDLLKMSDEEMESIYRKLGMDPNFELDDSILLDDDFSIDSFSEELNVEPEVVEILFRRKGLGDSHIESNRMAVMTQDRIDKRIKEHGSSNPDYARRYISRISPKDFIDMTVYERNMGRDQFDANVMGDLGSKMSEWDYEKQLRDSEEPPVLIVDQSTGQIIGHNGRHRVRALELAGIESVEIEVQFHDADGYMVKYGAKTIPDMAVSSQFDTKIETRLSNIIPLNMAHRAEIMENYGETAHKDAGVRYAVDETEEKPEYAPTFYSKMERVVEAVKQDKLGAASVVPMLKGKGVKDEEIKWSGIATYLEDKKSVSKQEMLDFIKSNSLKIETEILTGEYDREGQFVNRETGELFYRMGDAFEEARKQAERQGWNPDTVYVDELGDDLWVLLGKDPETNNEEVLFYLDGEYDSNSSSSSNETKWGEYKTPGGENYREYLYKLPDAEYSNDAMEVHWGRHGVLAHARVQDFETRNGQLLFIEEIQSDWHNEGHKEGYSDGINASEIASMKDRVEKLRSELADAYTEYKNVEGEWLKLLRNFDMISNNNERWQQLAKPAMEKMAMASYKHDDARHKFVEAQNALQKLAGKVPDAPFRKNYHEFVLKNLLREAAENGYTHLAWTTGQMQEDRWSSDYAEGYRIEYDQDIPKFLNKYGKQWGAKVEKMNLENYTPGAPEDLARAQKDLADWQRELQKADDEDQEEFIKLQIRYTEKEIEELLNRGDLVWAIPITPAMRDSVLYEGQPRYAVDSEDDLTAAMYRAFDAVVAEAEKNPPVAPASQSDSGMTGWVIYNQSVGAAALRFDPYTYLLNEYGQMEPTGKNYREFDVPPKTADDNYVTKAAVSIANAEATPDKRLADIAEAVVDGKLSYFPVKNKILENRVRRRLMKNGWEETLAAWTQAVHEGKTSDDLIAMGATLLNNAGNSDMDGKAYIRLMTDYAELTHRAGSALQASKILKRLSPEGKLYGIQKKINEMNEDAEANIPHDHGVPVSLWMDRVGELLADELYKRVDVKENTDKVVYGRVSEASETILTDLYSYAKTLVAAEPKVKGKVRTEMQRLQDLFDNKDKYAEAWQIAKNRLTDEFGADPNIYAALEAFIQDELKIAKRLTKELTGQSEIVMSETLAEMYLAADTDEKRDAVMEMILQDIADQIPATWGDKFQAWRYTAMLGNFRTPIRNTLGNVVMGTTALGKRAFAGIVEAGLQKIGKLDERTTSLLRDSETLKAAKDDYQTIKDIISGGGKYQDGKDQMNLQAEIRKRQRVFKNALLEGWRTKTQWVMENEYFGDAFFGQATYADALARYIAANGTTWSQASEELKDKAREVAIREAAEATFRDNNQFSKLVTSIRFRNPDTAAKKAANLVVEGVLPFKKTPANILVRATEYSPLGLVNAVAQTVAKSADKSEASVSEIVDNYCKGLTGSAILGMGVMLAEMGLLQASAPDDEKEKELWGMQGHQEYAIEFSVGGKQYSYTIDWVSPVSIPLLVGAELYEAMQSKGLTKREMIDVSMAIFDPMLQMSMLQGLNDALSNAQTWGDESALTKFVGNSIWGYLTQSIPTLLGQAERASVNTRMTTYADKNKDVPDGLQRILGKASAKIPGVEYGQTVYMDAWGRTQANASNTTLNVIEQFLSPGYANTIVESDMEKELLRLKEATGDSGVLIASAPKYFNVNKERKDLTAAEYLTYAKTRGQTAYSLLTEMTESAVYNGMSDAQKVYAVEKAYDYANQIAKELVTSVAPNKEDRYKVENWVAEARTNAAEIGLDVSTYLTAYGLTKEFVSLKDEKDETVDNSLALKKASAVLDIPGLTNEQRVALADALGSNKTVLGWLKNNPNVIKSKLAALEKKYG